MCFIFLLLVSLVRKGVVYVQSQFLGWLGKVIEFQDFLGYFDVLGFKGVIRIQFCLFIRIWNDLVYNCDMIRMKRVKLIGISVVQYREAELIQEYLVDNKLSQ